MKLQRLLSLTRQAIDDYQMIQTGDHIMLGISGGKDSLTLLYALSSLKKFYPNKFELSAITVDLGFEGFDLSPIKALCEALNVPFTAVHTEIGKILFEARKEANPCALCAKMRKGALNSAAKELGCNKIAYAHHRDDLIETMLLSLIRPMIYVPEADVIGFKNKYQLPVCKNPCPVDGKTKREYVKNLTKTLNQENPGVKERLFHAIIEGNIDGWPPRIEKRRGL